MSKWTNSPMNFEAGEDLAGKRLVKPSTTEDAVIYCDATLGHNPIGVNDYPVEDGDTASIVMLNKDGSFQVTASGAISRFAEIYPAADGKVSALPATGGIKPIGLALEASTADGDIIEAIFYGIADVPVAPTVLSTAAPAAVPGSTNQISSAANAVDATLGSGLYIGQQTRFVMTEASNSSTVSITLHETSDPEVATFDAVDEYLVVEWSGTEWVTIKATATFV